jgi:hypothetical protein
MSDTKIKTSNIGNLAVTHALLHTDMDLTSKTVQVATPTSNTHPATKAYVDTEVANLIDSAPGTLDTLNELAAAINDDANFNATIASSIATKLPLAGGTLTGNLTLASTASGSSASPELELRRDITGADANYIGQIKFTADNDADQNIVFAKITGKILDASDGTEDGILEITHKKAGSNNISARFRSDSLQLINGTNLTVAGTTELTGNLTVDTNTLYVDTSNNRVGIGTASPDYDLVINNSSGPTLRLDTNLAAANASVVMTESNGTSSSNGGFIRYNGADNRLELGVGTSWNTTRMVIDRDTGNVGIGQIPSATSSYIVALQVGEQANLYGHTDGTGAGSATYLSNNITHNSGEKYINSDSGSIYAQSSGSHKWYNYPSGTAGATATPSELMRIDASGNVGIGESSPTFALDLQNNAGTNPVWGRNIANLVDGETNDTGLRIGSSVGTDGLTQLVAATNTSASQFGFMTFNGSAWGERMRIDSSGRLLLGTTTSFADGNSEDLQIAGSGDTGMMIKSGTSSYGSIYFGDATSGGARNAGIVRYKHGDDNMQFWTAEGERVRIDSNGNVGIGEDTPLAKLHVVGGRTSGTTYNTIIAAGGVNSTDGSGARIILSGCENDPLARGTVIEGISTGTGNSHILNFKTNNGSSVPATRMTIGHTGNVGIGTTNPQAKLHVEGTIYANNGHTVKSVTTVGTGLGEIRHRYFRHISTGVGDENFTLMRYARHWWGTGWFQIIIRGTYYGSNSKYGVFTINGHTRSGLPSIQSHINNSGTATPFAANYNSTHEACDIRITLPQYEQYNIEFNILASSPQTSAANVGHHVGNSNAFFLDGTVREFI